MKKRVAAWIIVFGLFLYSGADAETFLWKIKGSESALYLGGTIHLLRKSDYPLPKEYVHAYRDSQVLVLEADIGKLETVEMQQLLLSKVTYNTGKSLDNVLSPSVYGVLNDYCISYGIPLVSLKQFKPSLVIMSLLRLELFKNGISETGVDTFFHKLASADGKMVCTLESIETQIEYIAGMGEGMEDDFVLHSVRELKNTSQIIGRVISAWRTGDEKKMAQIMNSSMERDFPDLYRKLIVERNNAWKPAIERYLKTTERELILVGAGHLSVGHGLIRYFKNKGYAVEKLHIP